MNTVLSAAYSELTRVLPWTFRAQGLKFGHADRLAHLAMRTAAIEPGFLAMIAAPDRIATRPLSPPVEIGRDLYLAEAEGCSGLFVAAPLLDWLAARSEARATAALVRGGAEMAGLQMLRVLAPDYGGNLLLLAEGRLGWVAAETKGLGEAPEAEALPLPGAVAAMLRQAQALARAGDRILLFWRGEWHPGVAAAETLDRALDRVMSRGLDIAPELLSRLYALETLTWAPTSERSRLQAGFVPRAAAPAGGKR